MCPVQTTYSEEIDAAHEGQRVEFTLFNVDSKAAEGSDIAAGRAVVRGTGDKQCKLPSATGQAFLGVTEYTSAGLVQANGDHVYEEKREVNFVDYGKIWVYTEQAVVPGDSVFFRHTADTAPLDVIGRFRKDTSGGDADQIVGATFETTGAAGDLVQIKINSPGLGISVAPDSSEIITATSGAISLDTRITYFDSTLGASTSTLADGVEGQRKTLKMLVDGGDQVLTPANFLEGATLTFDAADSAELLFSGSSWGLVGTATAATA